ncbi:hypothetical protein LZ554_005752 [Drepanopeziza brunnea f. sp. 'monogermtubi']|nr:hypothetical protein LZ554_005752 [Drepanopeziza brunnea f. sp. 'monogermtubi']
MPSGSRDTLRSKGRSGETYGKGRRERGKGGGQGGEYVYGPPKGKAGNPEKLRVRETRVLGRNGESSSSEEEIVEVRRSKTSRESPRKIKVVYATKEEGKASKHKEPKVRTVREEDPVRRSRANTSRRKPVVVEAMPPSPPKRSATIRTMHSDRRELRRSNTLTSHVPSTRHLSSAAQSNPTMRRASFMGSFFGPGVPPHNEPEKLIECLICLSDDIPRSKSAKLKCGHRMCHSCLKRSFRLSVTDPAHMPPKCCSAEHIPLKHVEKLFNIEFKKTWNRKFQEFSTKNRIYCPARRCGEWIKPANMHKEDGKKYGKCGQCRTKVCCACNGKWHGARDCPKDEETNKLLETAKKAGWQRCYSCRTMVELKEGCNHMTCHCTAEFCMICGLKWKTCDCPWFNYEAVEQDRLNHMQIPPYLPIDGEAEDRPRRLRRPRPPNTYLEEITERQRQERRDEALARRMQRAIITDDHNDDYQGGIGDIHGVGNGAGHFMNQDYVREAHNIPTGNFDHARAAANYVMGVANARAPPPVAVRQMNDRYPGPSPPPVLRRHSVRDQAYNNAQPRPADRVVPRRSRADYEAEAAVHNPSGRDPFIPPSPRVSRTEVREPRPSVLAGLGGRGNRVSAWRSHVEPGVEPEEGVLSMVSQAVG